MSVLKAQPADMVPQERPVGAGEQPAPAMRLVPEKPSMEMLATGSKAGGVSVETAWNIYQAMLKAMR